MNCILKNLLTLTSHKLMFLLLDLQLIKTIILRKEITKYITNNKNNINKNNNKNIRCHIIPHLLKYLNKYQILK